MANEILEKIRSELKEIVPVAMEPCILRKVFFLLSDFGETVGNILVSAKKHGSATQEKIRISQMLIHLSPFVPPLASNDGEKRPSGPGPGKRKK